MPPPPSSAIQQGATHNPTARCLPTSPRFSPVSRVRSQCMPSSHACGRRDAKLCTLLDHDKDSELLHLARCCFHGPDQWAFAVLPTSQEPRPTSVSCSSGGLGYPSRLAHVLASAEQHCATSGALASRAVPVERAIARVCQKAGHRWL